MSVIKVDDMGGGKYRAVIEFSYGECERLPFNVLRRIRAKLKTLRDGGLVATADFNIRVQAESATFLEILEMFGEDGSFIHGSAADPAALAMSSPPQDSQFFDDDGELEIEGPLNDSAIVRSY